MMSAIELIFEIKGVPKGKARPRFTKQGRAYTPKETVDYEREIANVAHAAAVVQGWRKVEKSQPLRAEIVAKFPIAASWTKAKKAAAMRGEIRPTVKPDGDNIVKAVLDALNGVVFDDDSQVVEHSMKKQYADNLNDCGVWVKIQAA